jgi:hypothetical protein
MNTAPSSAYRQLASRARERFVADLAARLPELVAAFKTRLTELLEQVSSVREMQDRRDAWSLFQSRSRAWEDGTSAAWRRAAIASAAAQAPRGPTSALELVDDEVVENKILAARLGLAVQDAAGSDYADLRTRMLQLDGADELGPQDVMRPEALVLLLIEQWAQAGLDRQVLQWLAPTLQKELGPQLQAACRSCNEILSDAGVVLSTDLRNRVKRTEFSSPGAGSSHSVAPSGWADADSMYGDTPPGRAAARGGPGAAGFGSPAGGGHGGAAGGAGGSGGYGGYGAGGGSGGGGGSGRFGGSGAFGGSSGPSRDDSHGHPSSYQARGPGAGGVGSGGGGHGHDGETAGARGQGYGEAAAARGQGYGDAAAARGQGAMPASGQPTRRASEEPASAAPMSPLARARRRAQGVLGQLRRVLTDHTSVFEPTAKHEISPTLAYAISRHRSVPDADLIGGSTAVGLAPDYSPAGVQRVAGVLRERSNELKRQASTNNEKATIEIVALMFQSILAEERIPPSVRVWFARLQLPVLRVALAEPEFFGTLSHPARQLIDRMGSCAMGFDATAIGGSALESEIRRVVQVIEQYPETGRRVFQLVYDEFLKFLSKYLTEKGAAQRVVSVAQQIEQKETLAIQYTIELRNMLQDIPVRDEVREFLFKVWAEVLSLAAVRKGAQDEETVALKRSAADLVWAASAKPNRADRARVIQSLPQLLQRLRQGMTLLGLASAVQEAHIKRLSDTLADAFMSKTEAIPQARIDQMAARLANLEDFVTDESMGDLPLDADSIEMMLGIDASSIDVIPDAGAKPTEAMLAWVYELQLGHWFTLDHNQKISQVQFAWRSERRQLHLFASMDGRSYLVQAKRLAVYLQAGLLVPQEEEALTLRATRQALEKLDANPERLLAT